MIWSQICGKMAYLSTAILKNKCKKSLADSGDKTSTTSEFSTLSSRMSTRNMCKLRHKLGNGQNLPL